MHDLTPGHTRYRIPFIVFCVVWILLLLALKQAKAQSYTVRCGEDPHSAIAAAGNPSVVSFEPGCVYRLARRIDPREGQQFIGNGATLSGSKVLTGWTPQGAYWYASGQTQEGVRRTVAGETMCESSAPRCNYPELLFRNGLPLKHGATLGAGEWFFDYDANRIYIYTDPANALIETSFTNPGATNCAICGGANNVTVRGFVITQFGTTLENAVVEGFTPGGQRWLVENNTIEYNGAVGAVVRTGGIMRNNKLLRNGQAGYGASGSGVVIENNEVGYNNWKGVNPNFSAGGGKVSFTTGLTFRGNHVHHNYKRGSWFDLDNRDSVVENNTFEHNDTGLYFEMGYSAIARNNVFRCNGAGIDNTFETSILVTNASGILIERNEITVCEMGNAIGIREDGNRPTRQTDNIDVRDNTVIFSACRGAVGQDAYLGAALGRVTWERNLYRVCSATYKHWLVEGVKLSFFEWQSRNPSDSYIVGIPIPKPTATATPSATPPEFATMTPEPVVTATMTKTPAVYWRFEIDVIIRGWCLATCD